MDNNKTVKNSKKVPSRRKIATIEIATIALLGAALGYTGVSTDDARDAATPEQREHIAPVAVTMTMEGIAAACFLAAGLMLKKRQKQR